MIVEDLTQEEGTVTEEDIYALFMDVPDLPVQDDPHLMVQDDPRLVRQILRVLVKAEIITKKRACSIFHLTPEDFKHM